MNAAPTNEIEVEPHEPHWITRIAFPILVLLFAISQVSMGIAVYHHRYWVAVPLVFAPALAHASVNAASTIFQVDLISASPFPPRDSPAS